MVLYALALLPIGHIPNIQQAQWLYSSTSLSGLTKSKLDIETTETKGGCRS